MAKIKFIHSRKDAQWGFQLNDGRIIEIKDKAGKFRILYSTPFNLKTGEIGPQPEYTPVPTEAENLPVGFTNLNILTQTGQGKTVFCYDKYEINLGFPKTVTIRRALKIAREFQKHGFNVNSVAVMHNFEAWKNGLKSGYRDEKRGIHLFNPCGGNPFSLTATTLEECCRDWQKTYFC